MTENERAWLKRIAQDIATCPDQDMQWLVALAEREAARADAANQAIVVLREVLEHALEALQYALEARERA